MQTYEVRVASGDVLVLATDGVYDNLYESEIVDLVASGLKKGTEPSVSCFSTRNWDSCE
jgi:serine/threonine protein phosphatase PrpC